MRCPCSLNYFSVLRFFAELSAFTESIPLPLAGRVLLQHRMDAAALAEDRNVEQQLYFDEPHRHQCNPKWRTTGGALDKLAMDSAVQL